MRTLLVLGGGTAGTMAANKLRHRLDAHEWRITVVDRDDEHHYQPGYLFIPFGDLRPRARSSGRGTAFLADGVELVLGEIDRVDADGQHRRRSTDGRDAGLRLPGHRHRHDAAARPDARACSAREWRESIFDFYTLEGAEALADSAARLRPGGRLVVHVTEMPIKCPVAPLEFTFLAEAWLRERGLRDRVEIVYVTPLRRRVHQAGRLRARSARCSTSARSLVEPDFMVERIDDERQMLVSYDEREVPFDLLVTVPLNMGADFVARSGLGDELNYVPVDKHTLLSTAYDNDLRARRRQRHPDLEGRLGRPLRGRGLRRQLPRARRRAGR